MGPGEGEEGGPAVIFPNGLRGSGWLRHDLGQSTDTDTLKIKNKKAGDDIYLVSWTAEPNTDAIKIQIIDCMRNTDLIFEGKSCLC